MSEPLLTCRLHHNNHTSGRPHHTSTVQQYSAAQPHSIPLAPACFSSVKTTIRMISVGPGGLLSVLKACVRVRQVCVVSPGRIS